MPPPQLHRPAAAAKPAQPAAQAAPQTQVIEGDFSVAEQPIEDGASKGDLVPKQPKRSILRSIAHRYHMEPDRFEQAVIWSCFPKEADRPNEAEFAAFLLVCYTHGLNPIRREVFGFRAKSGAIVPVLSVDGWVNIINQHPQMDGMEFEPVLDEKTQIFSVTCRIFRKDRSHHTEVSELYSECYRPTDPWKDMPNRMLRHKSLIQCARYAFGFSGLYDADEARDMGAQTPPMQDITPAANGQGASQASLNHNRDVGPPALRKNAPAPPTRAEAAPPSAETQATPAAVIAEGTSTSEKTKEATKEAPPPAEAKVTFSTGKPPAAKEPMPGIQDGERFLAWLEDQFAVLTPEQPSAVREKEFDRLRNEIVIPRLSDGTVEVQEACDRIMRLHERRLGLGG